MFILLKPRHTILTLFTRFLNLIAFFFMSTYLISTNHKFTILSWACNLCFRTFSIMVLLHIKFNCHATHLTIYILYIMCTCLFMLITLRNCNQLYTLITLNTSKLTILVMFFYLIIWNFIYTSKVNIKTSKI